MVLLGILILLEALAVLCAVQSLLARRVDDLELWVRLLLLRINIVAPLLLGRQLQLILGNTLLSGDDKR